jgi:hypothetical protein
LLLSETDLWGDRLGPWSPPKSGIKKKISCGKKNSILVPHKNKQTLVPPPLHRTKTNPGPSPKKKVPMPPQKKNIKKKKNKESKTGHLHPKKKPVLEPQKKKKKKKKNIY